MLKFIRPWINKIFINSIINIVIVFSQKENLPNNKISNCDFLVLIFRPNCTGSKKVGKAFEVKLL